MIGEICALLAALCWAVTPVLYKKSLRNVSYLPANLVRSVFATLLLLAILPATRYDSSTITLNQLALIIIGSIIMLVIADTLYFIGLKKIGVSRTQPIASSYPLYSMLLAAVVLNEEIKFAVAVGTLLIVLGIAIVSLTKNENYNAPNSATMRFGVASSIIAAVLGGIGLIIFKMALNDVNINSIFVAFISRIAVLPFLFLAVVAAGELNQIEKLTKTDVTFLAVAGMLGIGLAGIFLFLSLALIDASRAIPLSSISPLPSLILASIYAQEKVGTRIVVGTVLVVMGIILVTFYAQ